jgi:hypothetical protein
MELNGQAGELHMTLQITRKETGKVEEIELIGYLDPDKLKKLETEQKGNN